MIAKQFKLGTSSFSERDWVGPFYPIGTKPGDYFAYYTTQFNSVEIDASYYAVPATATVERWKRLSPPGFIISAKFPRTIVHGGEEAKPNKKVVLDKNKTYQIRDQFLAVMSLLGEHLGPLVIQYPYFGPDQFASAEPFMEYLDRFLSDLPKEFRYAVEVRNPTWITPEFADLLRKHNVALVLVDHGWMPKIDQVEKMFDPITTDFAYVRLLGDRKRIETITTEWNKEVLDQSASLQVWTDWLVKSMNRHIEVFMYIDNHFSGHSPATVRKLAAEIVKIFGRP